MSVRVFISHSTWLKPDLDDRLQAQLTAHAAFRDLLCERLQQVNDPKIEVIIDKTIPAGRFWREFLFDGIAECHAAIVLLNEQALHHSPWVDTEVTVLGYRAYNERTGFRLIVVPFGGVKAADIAGKTAWKPIALTELQVEPRSGLDEGNPEEVNKLIQKIIGALRELAHFRENAPSGWLVARLCNLLPSELHILKLIAENLNLPYDTGTSASTLRRGIARFLYANGPLSVLQLVKCPALPQDWDGFHILEILGTYWVDMSASIGVLSCCRHHDAHYAVAINGMQTRYTPQIYVRQVCGELVRWPVIEVDPRHAVPDQVRETLVEDERFRSPLKRLLGQLDRASPKEVETALNTLMASPNAVPVFVTFLQPGGGNVDDIIRGIRQTFPHIRVLVCTGTKPKTNPVLPPEVQMLMPELDLEREAKELTDYCSVETHISS